MNFWQTLHNELNSNHKVVFMYVLHSEGSSPGRQGFKMIVSESGLLFGSIGGGFMEHKLVELCKEDLLMKDFQPFIKRQIHQANVSKDKSGMICSGEQTIAFYQLNDKHIDLINKVQSAISKNEFGTLDFNKNEIKFNSGEDLDAKFEGQIESEFIWQVKEDLGFLPELHIVGGGHVGLALSKLAAQLDFEILIYDDRQGLNTMNQNEYAETIFVPSYESIGDFIFNGIRKYVVLMSFGFRTDKVVLKQLINHEFKYLGMMGSKEKVKQLIEELLEEGIDQIQLDKVYTPIGIPINSRTPEEIAVSILAEIIQVKNN